MRLFKRHQCPTRHITMQNEIKFCSHEQLMPLDKRKNYALRVHHDLSPDMIKHIKTTLEASGYKIKLIYNGNWSNMEEWMRDNA